MKLEKIINQEEDFAKWYDSVIKASELILNYDVKGTMIFQPYGWSIWQNIVNELDKRMSSNGVKNVQLPSFIKRSDFLKEKSHVEGFNPETFNIANNNNIDEQLMLRPTSEIIFCHYFKKTIHSYNSLPLKLNQWCNVFRMEKNTKPFLRNCEFFWQELHTAHNDENEAYQQAIAMHEIYKHFLNYFLCIPTIEGEKSEQERFAGAKNTFTLEALMQDGQMLQCATSHYLGQNFAKAYDIKFQTSKNILEYIYQTSSGLSTRIIGALIMVHGDNKGLVLPFGVSPIQINLIPLFSEKNEKIKELTSTIYKKLKKKYKVNVDDSENGFGFKLANAEVKGIPINIVYGPNDFEKKQITLIRRDDGIKQNIKIKDLFKNIDLQIKKYQVNIYNKALNHLNASIIHVKNKEEFINTIKNKKIALAPWCGDNKLEKQIKLETGATIRCIYKKINNTKCFYCGEQAKYLVYFARAY